MGPLTIETVGLPAFLVLMLGGAFIGALMSGKLRFEREYLEMKEQRDRALSRLERSTVMTERGIAVAEKVVGGPG